jgi:hypothetical protein
MEVRVFLIRPGGWGKAEVAKSDFSPQEIFGSGDTVGYQNLPQKGGR